MTNHIIYTSIYNVLQKKQSYVRRISQLNLVRRFKKRSNFSLYDRKFDLIYYHRNLTEPEPGTFPNVSFPMLYHVYHDNSISHFY